MKKGKIMDEMTGAAGTREWILASQNIHILLTGPDAESETSSSAVKEEAVQPDSKPDQQSPPELGE